VSDEPTAGGPEPNRGLADLVAANPAWYHTLDLGQGVVTPGWFDLRPVLDRMPWPDVSGKRCLDVGPYDGALAFELERRGAAEVIAADIADTASWDWPLRLRVRGPEVRNRLAGVDPGAGFKIAKQALSSKVERVEVSIYELSPESVGEFDVISCGSLLLHLQNPVAGLEAIHSVCRPDGHFLSAETISPGLSLLRPKAPVAQFESGEQCRWWTPNRAGHKALLRSAGFTIEREAKPYAIPFGPGHHVAAVGDGRPRRTRLATRLLGGGPGLTHAAVLARPEALGA